mmetsp:Transcript_12261/g.12071  ORF Transcript_12261/g.12071 Transcript_12261/m.12071 type:complete len:110 (-) Transcript_12261:1525-1854(-)
MMNDFRHSRLVSSKDQEEDNDLLRESLLYSGRESFDRKGGLNQKRPSMKSLVLDQIKFINDDQDTYTDQRDNNEMRYEANQYHEESTPMNSTYGGLMDDDWNKTIKSFD